MRRSTQAEIAGYVALGESMDKAGAYAIQSETLRRLMRESPGLANETARLIGGQLRVQGKSLSSERAQNAVSH